MGEFITESWNSIKTLGADHNVDPVLFAVLYVVTIPLYLISLGRAVKNYRRKKPFKSLVVLTVFFFVLPALYVLFFGKNVVWWVYAIFFAIILYSIFSVFRKFKRKVKEFRE